MSKIAKAADEILDKMSFSDYKKPSLASFSKSASRRSSKKNKLTLYLTEEEEKLFNEIYIKRLQENRKTDRSTLFAEAVKLLYRHEVARDA
ncbi:hypothetical protein COB11_06100 [Candidatus Aerophobetes bacterium]|uniref:Uncharacterized protein n=1 Tax=Aerophobetes bacterium TaxID=2030807 RepID=A0A2A4YE62_UNCAE|nr:MAG: hypothetical protein COB11_06100 [Candidatus Aerophobetes bacterium]